MCVPGIRTYVQNIFNLGPLHPIKMYSWEEYSDEFNLKHFFYTVRYNIFVIIFDNALKNKLGRLQLILKFN